MNKEKEFSFNTSFMIGIAGFFSVFWYQINYIKDSTFMKNIFLNLRGQVVFVCFELFKVKW